MSMSNVQAVILAAGKSTRFGTGTTKQLAQLCGKEMVLYPVQAARQCGFHTTVVVGSQAQEVEKVVSSYDRAVQCVLQAEQKGTGHALVCAKNLLDKEHVLVMNGDMPLITQGLLEKVVARHKEEKSSLTLCSMTLDNPGRYGRVIENSTGGYRVVEEQDCETSEERSTKCVNVGLYVLKKDFLLNALSHLQASSKTGEVYITDLVARAEQNVTVYQIENVEGMGVNTLKELSIVDAILQKRIKDFWMERGVRFFDPASTYIDENVFIGVGSIIERGVVLQGETMIGARAVIQAYAVIRASVIDDDAIIKSHSVIEKSRVERSAKVGPFARLRGEAHIGPQTEIGNFVEVKKSFVSAGTKVKHLSYLGDAHIGFGTNIGAGTVTCNYDGKKKHTTTIGDHVMVGANSSLVAPVTLEDESYVAAGSTITKDVPAHALGIGRARQENKEGWARFSKKDHKKEVEKAA